MNNIIEEECYHCHGKYLNCEFEFDKSVNLWKRIIPSKPCKYCDKGVLKSIVIISGKNFLPRKFYFEGVNSG